MKKIYVLMLLVFGISCNDTSDVLGENFTRGGLVVWEEVPETFRLNFLDIETVEFSHGVEDPNDNIISYDLDLTYGDITVDQFITITTFPNTLTITGLDILAALNLTPEEVDVSVPLEFVATVNTTNGVFSAAATDFDSSTNTNNGGEGGPELFDNPGFNQAVNFSLNFFLPPPKKLRGTSFEEPFGNDERYTKPGGETESEELTNNPGERAVMYTAVGTGVDDEIGFKTEVFFVDGDLGFTSERIGVSTDAEAVGGQFVDGVQGYQIEDIDGLLRLTFDRVPVDNVANPSSGVQIQYFAEEDDHESGDNLTITAFIERAGGETETLELLNISGTDIDNGLEGRWILVDSGFLTDIVAYTLIMETNIDSGNEDIYFDQMLVYTVTEDSE
ncbi:hypothetical protein FVB32_00380 [Flagellimonas hymeniacidonis]|uniref:Uncharacterized protein n=1 Tax=Flagellimonas hymeniacidonis TaxID=2603628 RepID=A0A5C8V5X1_9FLAO|nr:hypothetical protein [Flagellimonas hymeniacidonis]TXN36776.1 hypothetical protein FVB32_00380 [Flagellimonas hymeniacidonis]